MDVDVHLVVPRRLAAVRREVVAGEVGSAWRPALDLVWAFVRTQPGLWTEGHNVFVYHHRPDAPLRCEFGVEVTRTFEPTGEVYPTETPAGEAAVAVHRGSYDLTQAYDAITHWMASNDREPAGHSWEIYGDPSPDPAGNETTVFQLLRPRQP